MTSCNRSLALDLGDGYHLYFLHDDKHDLVPGSRGFDLPGNRVQYAPDRPADVQHLKLVVTLDFERETVRGTAYTTFSALYEEVTSVTFDAVELHIEDVSLTDGKKLSYTTSEKQVQVTLDRPYQHGEQFTIAITYFAKPRIGMNFIKPAPEDPTRPVQAWSFGQPRYHSYWFPCHDAPNDRATTEIIATVPAQFLTISNGNLLSVTDNGETKTHHWRHDIPHATYLISLVVGDFAVIEDQYNGKPVTYYVRKDRRDDATLLMGKTPAMMRFFSEYTGVEYPYDKYAQTVVELYMGAMEHTTATTHSFSQLTDARASLDIDFVHIVAHELAHQWFGDLVTCRDWPNGWLNEGFATYFEELWTAHDRGIDYFKWSMLNLKQRYMQEDNRYRRPIVYHHYYNQGSELFDLHMYFKGAWVLHMLRHQLGEPTFKRAINTYIERYRTKEVITPDLERTLEEVTGRSLGLFFEQWVYRGGYPALTVNYSWDSDHHMAKLKIKQTQKVDELTPCFLTPVDLAFTISTSDEADASETRTISMRVIMGEDGQVEQTFYIPLEREPLMVRVDPDGWLLKTLAFERPAKMLRYQLAHDPDVLGRIEATEALGKQKDEESLEALTNVLNNDAFWGVRTAAASALGTLGSEQAQTALLKALRQQDAPELSRVRSATAAALGKFQAPQRRELAERSADALRTLLEQGDISYRVESASADALGKTRTEGSVDTLLKLIDRPSWLYTTQQGVFSGLAASGEERVVDIMAGYLSDPQSHPSLRRAVAAGFIAFGHNRYLYSEEVRQRAVTALINGIEHDGWFFARALYSMALDAIGDKRAIAPLERSASQELESFTQYYMRVAAHDLRTTDKDDEQLKLLRKDLDEVREENRKLKEQVGALEARMH